MTSPDVSMSDQVGIGVEELIKNAQRLGLVWGLSVGTVFATSDFPSAVQTTLDGDDDPTRCNSMIGNLVTGTRVFVLQIPPQGKYIIGFYGSNTNQGRQVYLETMRCDAVLGLTTVAQVISGTEHVITVRSPGAKWDASGVVDFSESGVGVTIGIGELFLDGVAEAGQILFGLMTTTDRATPGQEWSGTFAGPGVYNFDLRGRRTAAVGSQAANAIHSALKIRVFE